MPRFYFHIRGGEDPVDDDIGVEFKDRIAALKHAEQAARDMLSDLAQEGEPVRDDAIEIVDEAGGVVGRLRLRDTLRLT
ncbi:MAG: hypothetical protein BGP06_06275 [Rhizobiales bacterium 65-9]|nr:hypothetical protein [Hyphomicrobiales bacterium]OJY35452.1 MAG: hypothetical protein BGP06_06275 [Rhizobiales bacterium 65-9]